MLLGSLFSSLLDLTDRQNDKAGVAGRTAEAVALVVAVENAHLLQRSHTNLDLSH